MKAQFGKLQQINLATVTKNGQGVVAAEGYRVVSLQECPASESLSPECCCSGDALRAHRHATPTRRRTSRHGLWRNHAHRAVATCSPGAAMFIAAPAVDRHLPAPAWAALVLNHALCG
jgi:hypothetical protein